MDRHYIPPISIEKLASFLDGNLPEEEMRELSSLIGGDPVLSDIVSDADLIDELTEEASGIVLPEEIGESFSLPEVPDDDTIDEEIISGEEIVTDDAEEISLDGETIGNEETSLEGEIVGYEEIIPDEKPVSLSTPSGIDLPSTDSQVTYDLPLEPGLTLDDFAPEM